MSHFRFLDLPAELRNKIYTIFLTNTSSVQRNIADCQLCRITTPDIRRHIYGGSKYCLHHPHGQKPNEDSTNTTTGPLIPSHCLTRFDYFRDRDLRSMRMMFPHRNPNSKQPLPRHINPSILCVNRQCYHEAAFILYSRNRFNVPIEPYLPSGIFLGPDPHYLSVFPDIAIPHLQDVRIGMEIYQNAASPTARQVEHHILKWRAIAEKAAQMTSLRVLQVSLAFPGGRFLNGQWEKFMQICSREHWREPVIAFLRVIPLEILVWGLREGDFGYVEDRGYPKPVPFEETVLALWEEIQEENKERTEGDVTGREIVTRSNHNV